MKKIYIYFSVIIILFIFGTFLFLDKDEEIKVINNSSFEITLDEKRDESGGVEVSVLPLDLYGEDWIFQISLDTHTEELDMNMEESVILLVGADREYFPKEWEGDPSGGHHRSGKIIFEAPKSQSSSITLKMYGIGDTEERLFYWSI